MKKKIINNFISFLFLGIIFFIPIIGFISNNADVSLQENRNLTKWPNINDENYLSKTNDYLSDHFGGRNFFIMMYKKIERKFSKHTLGLKAVKGKNGWAFYEGCITHYEGKIKEEKIDRFIDKVRNLQNDFPEIPIFVVVVPNKAFIYNEYLPDYVIKKPQRFNTIKKLKSLTNINVLDLYNTLKESKQKTFMKNDTHWNGLGAYISYKKIINFINIKTNFNLKIKKDIKGIKTDNNFKGDISKMLGEEKTFIDKNNEVIFKQNFAKEIKKQNSESAQISDFLNIKGQKKIILFHDSFSGAKLAKYFAETFYEIKTFWSFEFKKYNKNIKKIKPDMIIIQVVDRHIS